MSRTTEPDPLGSGRVSVDVIAGQPVFAAGVFAGVE
jgi:hypothetical protein